VHGAVVVDMAMDEYTMALAQLPPRLARFIEFESTESYNPMQVLEFKRDDPFLTWDDLYHMLREASRNAHRKAFGGVHPALDPPRRVW
jgi:hypothetical protein